MLNAIVQRTVPKLTGVCKELEKSARYNAIRKARSTFIGSAIEVEDLYQECFVLILENQEKERAYLESILPWRLGDMIDRNIVRPPAAMRNKIRKRGDEYQSVEVSIDELAEKAGTSWQQELEEVMGIISDEAEMAFPPEQMRLALEELNRKRKVRDYSCIYHHKKQNSFEARVRFNGKEVTVGSFKDRDEAYKAKYELIDKAIEYLLELSGGTPC